MRRSESPKVENVASNRNIGRMFALAIVTGQFCSGKNVLFGTNQLRKDDNKKDNKGTAQPDKKVDGELLSPRSADVFSFHATDELDREIR